MGKARYYHKCPVCGRRRLCRGLYLRVTEVGPNEENHEIKCTTKCRGHRRLAIKSDQVGDSKHYIRCM